MDGFDIMLISQYGLIAVAGYLIYYIIKRNKFLEDKLIQVIENNTRVMQEMKDIINEFRHEIKNQLDRIEKKLSSSKD